MDTTHIITVIASVIGFYLLNNTKLKEGFTDKILSMMGKFGSKKIDLKTHKAFIIIKNYENHLNLFLFNSHTKSIFYKEFLGIIFKNISIMIDSILAKHSDSYIESNAEFIILQEIELCRTRINQDIENTLNVPSKIQNQIDHWKSLMLNALRGTIEQLITDDSNSENYFKIYRTLDAILTTANFITGTGSILFNNINGAFDEINAQDIYKNAGKC